MIDLASFKYRFALQLRWRDLDAFNHVNNAVYLTYLEMARGNYLEEVYAWDWNEHGMILAHISIDYKMPMLLTDKPYVYVRCAKIGNKSFDLDYAVVIERHGKTLVACTAKSVQVMYNYITQQTFAMPPHLKIRIADYEGIEV